MIIYLFTYEEANWLINLGLIQICDQGANIKPLYIGKIYYLSGLRAKLWAYITKYSATLI